MKKLIISVLPIFIVAFATMWILYGLKCVLILFVALMFVVAFVFGIDKWIEFVDKHIED